MRFARSQCIKQFVLGCVGLGFWLLASSAQAQVEDAPPPPTPQAQEASARLEHRWYGWQTLASDVASIGLFFGGARIAANHGGLYDSDTPMADVVATLGIVGYAAGGPVLHHLHHRPEAAAGSVGLRLGLPALGWAIGTLASPSCPPPSDAYYGDCGAGGLVVGVGVGVLAAIIIDATALGWEASKPEPPAGPRLSFAPVISNDGKR